MPNVTMLDLEQLKKTKLRPYIEKSLELRAPDPGFHAMMGHNVDLAESAYLAWTGVFNSGELDHALKEVVRITLSRAANCSY
jgi:hypothetical protein